MPKPLAINASAVLLKKQPAAPEPEVEKVEAEKPYGDNLNFRVRPEFRKQFRLYAVEHDLKLADVLYRAFDALLHSEG
jgi:hypothetical protein